MKQADEFDNHVTLDSGRVLSVYGHTLGLATHGELEVRYGWDGLLEKNADGTDWEPLTPAERRDIADHMRRRWREWENRPPGPILTRADLKEPD